MRTWYIVVARVCRWLYYSRVTVLGRERLPERGPTLFVGLHRNGAVDGCVYSTVIPGAVFMISTQLRRSLLGRLFFSGIEVVRDKEEGDPARNAAAVAECVLCLVRGGQLFIMPEGTSCLGPRHLPFRRGAARIGCAALGRGVPLRIVPLGIHYERAWAFRSRVEVVVGTPVETALPTGLTEPDRIEELQRRITVALEAVGAQFESEDQQAASERLAYVATLATERSYFSGLKQLEGGISDGLRSLVAAMEARLGSHRLLKHQGVPLYPMGPLAVYVAALAVLTPVVGVAAVANAPPLAAAAWAGSKFPDDRNVIALWRLLVGLPSLFLWTLVIAGLAFSVADARLLAAYVAITALGTLAWYRWKKLAVATVNGLVHPALREPMREFRGSVIRELDYAGG